MAERNDDRQIDKRPQDARQGEKGRPMLLVLTIGIVGLVIAYALVGWINSDNDTVSLSVIDEKAQSTPQPAPADQTSDQTTGTAGGKRDE
ncbi:hypothetical protein C8N35_11236 [Breoghania corrubedonensis]|uniref:Uncharacterized protein n=1 Tax=Breoghania corrubedonensis TaxID=665038 RepID=A0A2T5UW81_9HYPH|nr:hypothetical protein [Breoghania corrubedonensis]PTW55711.1 hypothetical protein C8N35_11236 [Breoghania corrubedonensis]